MLPRIVEQLQPSSEQEPAISDRGRDVVTTAGAGTGKTRTLVARYLALLDEGVPLRGIVAITFTKKAAREMRNRVREEIRVYRERTDVSGDERRRWDLLYSELDAARIGTIHSLCTELLHAHPAEAGVDPRFEVLVDGEVALVRAQAVAETLAWAADDEDGVRVFAALGADVLEDTLDTLLQRRLDVPAPRAEWLAHWGAVLTARQSGALEALPAGAEWRRCVAVLGDNEADDAGDKLEIVRRDALAAVRAAARGTQAQRLAALARLDGISLVGGRQNAWPGGKEQIETVKEALKGLRAQWREAAPLLGLALMPLDEQLAAMLPSLYAVFDYAGRRYDELKRERTTLDFDDLEGMALALLEIPAVRAYWQSQVRAILVDEFQDTNERQRRLIHLLNGDGGKLFIVGDARQSIYRFRGADVTVFRAERERIERAGKTYTLEVSYRAHRALIDDLNALLAPVLGGEADPARPWVEPFSPLAHHRAQPSPGFAGPHIELLLAAGPKAEALAHAAAALAGRLGSMVDSGHYQVRDGTKLRALDYGDIAILCRASTSFAVYEDALQAADVPFLTVSGRGFYGRPEVRDVLNALQAVTDPTDDLALAGLLRSPAMALPDEMLLALADARRAKAKDSPLWNVLPTAAAAWPEPARGRAERAVSIIAALHAQAGRLPVADLLKAFLDTTGYRAVLLHAGDRRGVRNLSKLLADAHGSGLLGVGEFLEYVAALRDSGTREGEARATAEGAVQIMSIHAAKGLEFPIVVLGDASYKPPSRRRPLLDPELGIMLALQGTEEEDEDEPSEQAADTPAVYRLARLRETDQESAEQDRLLYVAATRAREHLIISGHLRRGKRLTAAGWLKQLSEQVGLGLDRAFTDYDEHGSAALARDLACGGRTVRATCCEPGYRAPHEAGRPAAAPAGGFAVQPALLEPLAGPEAAGGAEEPRSTPGRVWHVVGAAGHTRAPAQVIGSLVHAALAAWRFPNGDYPAWARARARSFGLTDERQLEDAIWQSRELLERFQAHPLYDEMRQADDRLREVPYSLDADGHVDVGIIDALYRQGQRWTIVEFKTDRVDCAAEAERVAEDAGYRRQVQRYMRAAARLLHTAPRALICWLDCEGKVQVLDA